MKKPWLHYSVWARYSDSDPEWWTWRGVFEEELARGVAFNEIVSNRAYAIELIPVVHVIHHW